MLETKLITAAEGLPRTFLLWIFVFVDDKFSVELRLTLENWQFSASVDSTEHTKSHAWLHINVVVDAAEGERRFGRKSYAAKLTRKFIDSNTLSMAEGTFLRGFDAFTTLSIIFTMHLTFSNSHFFLFFEWCERPATDRRSFDSTRDLWRYRNAIKLKRSRIVIVVFVDSWDAGGIMASLSCQRKSGEGGGWGGQIDVNKNILLKNLAFHIVAAVMKHQKICLK